MQKVDVELLHRDTTQLYQTLKAIIDRKYRQGTFHPHHPAAIANEEM
jgi:hypothetical protein